MSHAKEYPLITAIPNSSSIVPDSNGRNYVFNEFPPGTRYLVVFAYGNLTATPTTFRFIHMNGLWTSQNFVLAAGAGNYVYETIRIDAEVFGGLELFAINTDTGAPRSAGTFSVTAIDDIDSHLGTVNQPVKVDPSNTNGFPVQFMGNQPIVERGTSQKTGNIVTIGGGNSALVYSGECYLESIIFGSFGTTNYVRVYDSVSAVDPTIAVCGVDTSYRSSQVIWPKPLHIQAGISIHNYSASTSAMDMTFAIREL